MFIAFKLFLRTLGRKKLFSIINIVGLSLGFLCSTLIYLYVENEVSYDQFHEHGNRIYRVNQTYFRGNDNGVLTSSLGPNVGYAIAQEIPDVAHVVRVHTPSLLPVSLNSGKSERVFNSETILAADSNFFQAFSYPMLYGDKNTALNEMNSVVLKYNVAKRFFGEINPVGNLIELGIGDSKESYKVTGVLADFDENSYIDFDMMVSMSSVRNVRRFERWSWIWTQVETFVVINENASEEKVLEKLNRLPKKYAGRSLSVMGYATYEEYISAGKEWKLYLQPFADIHLHSSNIYNRLNTTGNFKVVAALIGSAIFVILLSCINFINLSTSQFTTKAKSASLRKVLGSSRSALQKIYFGEAFMFCLVSAFLSLGLTYYMLPIFNQTVGLELSFSLINEPFYLFLLAVLVLFVSSLAGLYPAIFFSAFKPIQAMKGELKSGKSGVQLRNVMMVVQYALSLLLIICAVTVHQQLQYVLNAEMGFKKENTISIENVNWLPNSKNASSRAFVNEISKINGVNKASLCNTVPFFIDDGDLFYSDEQEAVSLSLNYILADENYTDLFELEMVIGRSHDPTFSNDVNGVILNETAIRSLGWDFDETILGKKIVNWTGEYQVIGVMKDFHYWTIQSPIEPIGIFSSASNADNGNALGRVALSFNAKNFEDFNRVVSDLESMWSEFGSNIPFEYTILDQVFELDYESEAQLSKIISSFSLLTIFIASLGLIGMVIFTIEQKLKEIGIRKVLGASSLSIVSIFAKSYIKLLLIALTIACPLGYYFMENWLGDFDYRIHISPGVFLFSGGLLLIVSMSISIYHSAKASNMNPAEVLKDE